MENEQEISIPQFTTDDLSTCQQIINIACERGAFKATEMSAIGAVYDRLTKFLEIQKTLINNEEETKNGT